MQRLSKSLFDLSVFHKWRAHLNNLFLFQSFFHVEYLRTHMMLHSGDQAGNSIFSCPNAPNCTKVCSTFSFSIFLTQRHLIDNNIVNLITRSASRWNRPSGYIIYIVKPKSRHLSKKTTPKPRKNLLQLKDNAPMTCLLLFHFNPQTGSLHRNGYW